MNQKKTVLVAPLNWGLGHATRLVPIIEALLRQQAKVILAADKRPYSFLIQRFPECELIRLPGFEPVYPKRGSMAFKMLFSLPGMMKYAGKANEELQKIIVKNNVDIVISDNRYEMHSAKVYGVFITHQLNIQTHRLQKLFQPLIRKIVYRYIRKYDELWIPDFEDPQKNLSGVLSHVKYFPVGNYYFTGPLSRFDPSSASDTKPFDLLVILSGPEPQRTVFEKLMTEQAGKSNLKTVILQSKPEEQKRQHKDNVTLISHAGDEEMAGLIKAASLIISRPGYSTIMDLSVFGKKVVFVPTPGQTEQQYLAERMKNSGYCYYENQKTFDLQRALKTSEEYKGLPQLQDNDCLETNIRRLLSGSSRQG